ncbi:hypothetical protein Vretimale_1409 [Volvox reticuliferus]|uniref:Uncharacterized protein n=1 Tax=Volvox reticuliferus TaxID=1737510 RepID=A0A8J4CN57_9CHLO|nr:hypothetical protein Vretifemale_10804 [Volvox reticuliferus]GIL95365.1 hypothetical protein Vretimale_1409 [Volvox reticuliferus]
MFSLSNPAHCLKTRATRRFAGWQAQGFIKTLSPAYPRACDVESSPLARRAGTKQDDLYEQCPVQYIRQSAAHIENLVNAICSSGTSAVTGRRAAPTFSSSHARTLWQELLSTVDAFLGATTDVRFCAALVQQYSNSNDSLQAVVQLLAEAASLEDALLTNPHAYRALLPPPLDDEDSSSHYGDGGGNGADQRVWRLFAALAPRFLREGYHPTDPRAAYSVALSWAEKAALTADVRRQGRHSLASMRSFLGSGEPLAAVGGCDAATVASSATLLPPMAPPGGGGGAFAPGAGLPYDWPLYELTAEELAADAVLAAVAAAQRRAWSGDLPLEERCYVGDGRSDGRRAGGRLVLTLDACGALLQRHPDPVLRQQVYNEGLMPLAAHALRLMQQMRDLRAKEASLYGLYDTIASGGRSSAPPPASPSVKPQLSQMQLAALRGGAAAPGGCGYSGLAHVDTLARDGRAAIAFLTSLAEVLEPLVAKQLGQLAHTASPNAPMMDSGSFEYIIRFQAWAADPETAAGDEHAMDGGDGGGGGTAATGWFLDPAAPYLTDLDLLMTGIGDWLADFMGVGLRRPGSDGGADGETAWQCVDGVEGGGRTTALDDADAAVCCNGRSGGDGEFAPVPYDVKVMLDELRLLYAHVEEGNDCSDDTVAAAAAAAAAGQRLDRYDLALAAVREAAAVEPHRFLAYRLHVEGEAGFGAVTDAPQPMQEMETEEVPGLNAVAPIRWLLIDSRGGFGARYLLSPLGTAGGAVGCRVAAVVVGLQSGGGGGGREGGPMLTRASEFMVWELLHELGHALHFLLAAAPPSSPPVEHSRLEAVLTAATSDVQAEAATPPPLIQPKVSNCSSGIGQKYSAHRHTKAQKVYRRLSHAVLPYQLPLELVELPSSVLERAAAEAEVLEVILSHCRHVTTGQRATPGLCRALAQAVQQSYYSPISVQMQVLSSLLDQLLLQSPLKAPGLAQRLWPQLLATFAPSLPVGCAVQQLQSIARIAAAMGQGYAYVIAAYLADELCSACGFGAPRSQRQQHAQRRSGVEAKLMAQEPHCGEAVVAMPDADVETQRSGDSSLQSCGTGDGLCVTRRRGRHRGRLLRRWLFEQDASEQPAVLLGQLLGKVCTSEEHDAGGGGVEGALRLMRVAGGGGVPKVCAERVRRWTGARDLS